MTPTTRSGWLPYVVAATFFMEYLDTTVIATALPQMARSFSVGPNELSLGMTAYMLTLAVFIPVSGWMADRFGARTVFGGAIVVFTLASILCGLSPSVDQFTAARVLQGLGGAMMVPVGRLIVVRTTDKSQLMKAIATITWPAIIAPVVGPSVGGFITTYASWPWIFLLNVPFGIAALCAVLKLVRNERGGSTRPLDLVGFVLSGIALSTLLYGTELASQQDANVGLAVTFVLIGIAVGALTWRHARGKPYPLLDFSTLKVPTFSVTVITGSASRIGIEAVPYLLPLLFQLGFGMSAFHSGLLMLGSALGNLSMKAFVNRLLRRFGFRRISVVNATLAGLLTISCGLLSPNTPMVVVVAVLFAYGLSRSLQFSTLAALAYADVSDSQKSPASTLWSVAQQMTIGMGIAFGALALRAVSAVHGEVAPAEQHFALIDFHWAFVAAGVLILLSVFGYAGLAADAGSGIGGGSKAPVGAVGDAPSKRTST